jgi:hypothetical protein
MKKILLSAMILLLSGTGILLFGQKIKSGSLASLKGQTVVNIQYDYTGMSVGKFENEADYVAKRTADMNRKEPGSGDTWAKAWVNDRTTRFHPMFIKNFNSAVNACGLTGTEGAADATYTLIIHTIFTEPGFNVGVTRQNAYINMEADLIETANPSNLLCKIEYLRIQSVNMMGYDFDTGGRIQSCYDRAGDNIGKVICKNLK